jgi:tetratricopeptide (TPR) repeat protein
MTRRCSLTIALAFACAQAGAAPVHAQAEQGLIGKRVVQKFGDFVLRDNDEPVERSRKAIDSYRVEQSDGRSLFLRAESQGFCGWAAANDVVPVEQAVDYFTQQIRTHRNDAFLHSMRAFLWREKREFDNALRDDNEAIALDPKNPAYYCNRGSDWHARKEYDKAIGDFDQAIRLDPKHTLAHVGRGMSRAKRKEYYKAITDLSEAIWLDPLSNTAYYNRGLAWQSKKEYAKAVVDYNMAIRLDPQHAFAYFRRAGVWVAERRFEKALTDFDEAIRLDPRFHDAYVQRAWLLATCPDAKFRDLKRAALSALKACELTKWQKPSPIEALAAAYAAMGDFDTEVSWQTLADTLHSAAEARTDDGTRLELDRNGKPCLEPDP